jgi:hypothetical protein
MFLIVALIPLNTEIFSIKGDLVAIQHPFGKFYAILLH